MSIWTNSPASWESEHDLGGVSLFGALFRLLERETRRNTTHLERGRPTFNVGKLAGCTGSEVLTMPDLLGGIGSQIKLSPLRLAFLPHFATPLRWDLHLAHSWKPSATR